MTNLLTKKPECHRELFDWTDGKKPKTTYSIQDLKNYYALSFSDVSLGTAVNEVSVQQFENAIATALANAPEMEQADEDELQRLVTKHGLEVMLYAIDLSETPQLAEIRKCIPDAEAILAQLIRTRDYGV